MLDGLRIANASTLAPLVRDGGANSDFYPILDLGAERTRYRKEGAMGFVGISGDRFALAPLLEERRAVDLPGLPRFAGGLVGYFLGHDRLDRPRRLDLQRGAEDVAERRARIRRSVLGHRLFLFGDLQRFH